MRAFVFCCLVATALFSCDGDRIYEENYDFESRFWPVADQPVFQFEIADTLAGYNLYCNIRNSVSYPYSRLFLNYYLQDSTGAVVEKKLTEAFLFDQKTGKPLGSSGLGDIYDQRLPLLSNYQFRHTGKFSIRFEQYMRMDSLQGILAVGLRVEKALPGQVNLKSSR